MTSYATPRPTTVRWPLLAALSIGISVVLTAIGTFSGPGEHDTVTDFLPVIGMILVGAAVVFGLVVRGATPSNAGRRAVILAVIGVLSVLVFWTGLPSVLAFGAIACALEARSESGRVPASAVVAGGLAVVALAGAVLLAFTG